MTLPLAAARAARGTRKGNPGRRTTPAAGRRLTPDLSPDEVTAELQRRRRAAAAGEKPTDDVDDQLDDAPAPAPRGGGPSLPAIPAAAESGSGFLLGVFAWALGLAYLNGGAAGVRKFAAAKFLNKV